MALDTDPADRRLDRLLAYPGLLDDAAPRFRSGDRLPRAGAPLALPAVIASDIFVIAREVYGSLGPAFYGRGATVVALLLMALLRIKRPEGLTEHAPNELGRLLGLDRAPRVETLRRALTRRAAIDRVTEFGRALARRRVAARGAALEFRYVDGHVRISHGARSLPKASVARVRLAMPATTDYWINTAADPLFVVTAAANAGRAATLPPVLDGIRTLVRERRVTVVFDRGGCGPALFLRLITAAFDREECALEAFVDYAVVPDDRAREIPNPRWRDGDAQLRQARADLACLSTQYGAEAFVNPAAARPTMRGLKIAQDKLEQQIRAARARVAVLEAARAAVPRTRAGRHGHRGRRGPARARTEAAHQPDQDGGLPGRERSRPARRALRHTCRGRRPDPHPVRPGRRGRPRRHQHRAAGRPGSARLAAPHARPGRALP